MPFKLATGEVRKSGERPVPDVWDEEARGYIRAELARRSITYKALERLLKDWPGDDKTSAAALANRINRGTFSFGFALRILAAIQAERIELRHPTAKRKREKS